MMTLTLIDFSDCLSTPEEVEAKLIACEQKLAEEFGITGNVRQELLRRSKTHELPDTPSVVEWQCAYTSHLAEGVRGE